MVIGPPDTTGTATGRTYISHSSLRQMGRDSTTNPSSSSTPSSSCLLLPTSYHEKSMKRILLQGPRRSGRTSLAMNLAYHCAMTTTMTTPITNTINTTTSTTTTTTTRNGPTIPSTGVCHCFLQPCCCTPVVFYRMTQPQDTPTQQQPQQPHSAGKKRQKTDDFPVWCRKVHDSQDDPEILYQNPPTMRVSLASTTTTSNTTMTNPRTSSASPPKSPSQQNEEWDPLILKRIRIHYIHSIRDLLQDLLEMMGKPYREHPTRAIVVDDLDLLCQNNHNNHSNNSNNNTNRNGSNGSGASEVTTRMMQALAFLVDTSHALQRLHGCPPPTVLVTMTRSDRMTASPGGVIPSWMDQSVTLSSLSLSSSSSSSRIRDVSSSYMIEQRWKACFRTIREQEPEDLDTQFHEEHQALASATVEYGFMDDPMNGPLIEWAPRVSDAY